MKGSMAYLNEVALFEKHKERGNQISKTEFIPSFWTLSLSTESLNTFRRSSGRPHDGGTLREHFL